MMIDTHAHISSEDYENIDEIVLEMNDNIIINSGTDQKRNIEVIEMISKYKNIYGTIGIHPEFANTYENIDIDFIENNLNNPKIVAVGEVGIDLYWVKDNLEKQKELFIKQLDLARKHNKTVVIHSREANEVVYDIIKNYQDIKKVMHCYSGDVVMARKLILINVMLGVGGVITFKNSIILKEVVKEIPLEYLLLETDSPYLSPYRGEKNKPINVLLVSEKIAEIKGISSDKVLEVTTKNAIMQFDLKV